MIISEKQFQSLPAELKSYFNPVGGGVGVANCHPT
jgi:hypothetical protein